jgi:NADH:ubiquinone oxidoreductase subunit 2 (subunit N)
LEGTDGKPYDGKLSRTVWRAVLLTLLYLLSTIYRNSELSTTGGLMYFLLGGLSSCFILLGTSLLYANSGTTNLDSLYVITSISDLNSGDITDGSLSI